MRLTRTEKLTLILLSITVIVVLTMGILGLVGPGGCLADQVRMSDGSCAPYVIHGLKP